MPRPSKYFKERGELKETLFKQGATKVQKEFAKRLYVLMCDNDLTQKDIAEKADVSVPSVSQYFRCEQIPKITTIENLSKGYNVSANYLLGQAVCPIPEIEEIHKETGLSNNAILKLKEYKKLLDEVPKYRFIGEHPAAAPWISSGEKNVWERKDNNGRVDYIPESMMYKEFEKIHNAVKPPKMIFETINKIIVQNDNSLLSQITAYLFCSGLESESIYVTNGDTLSLNSPDSPSPFEDKLTIQADLAEFILLNIEQTLKKMRDDILAKRQKEAEKAEGLELWLSQLAKELYNEEDIDMSSELTENQEELERQIAELTDLGEL